MKGRKRRQEYDYSRKPRSWRKAHQRDQIRHILLLIMGLSVTAYIAYLAITK